MLARCVMRLIRAGCQPVGAQNFYLLALDSPTGRPNSDNAFHLSQFAAEQLIDFPSLDGAVFLIDARQAKEGAEGAAVRWTEYVGVPWP
jgi:hypothetical protein